MREEKLNEIKDIIKKYQIVKREKIERENTFLKIETYSVTLENGKTIIREKIIKNNNGDAIIIIPFINEEEIIVNIEPRVFTKRGVEIGLPAGYIEKGETPEEAALRELYEETGYEAKLTYLGSFYQDVGISSAYNRVYLAQNLKRVGTQKLDEGEYIDNITIRFDELIELIDKGIIEDSNTMIAAQKAKKILRR